MQRVIGQKMGDIARAKNDKGAQIYAEILQQVRQPHIEAIDRLTFWSLQALREDRVLSDGIAKRYDAEADIIVSDYENISVPAEIPRGKE